MQGPAVAPHGVVGSTGIGNGLKSGSNAGVVGKVASAGVPGAAIMETPAPTARVASAGVPTVAAAAAPVQGVQTGPAMTSIEVDLQAAGAIHQRSPPVED